jgi:hypothetical protein
MKLKYLLALSVLVIAATSGTAAGKAAATKVKINGPGMTSPGTIARLSVVNRITLATLDDTNRTRIERPRSTGPAYELEFTFAVADANGGRTEIIRQTLYPFAAGGPVVLTGRGEKIDMSFGPIRFDPGWFEVPRSTVRELRKVGLPHVSPERETTTSSASHPETTQWPWFAGFAALTVGAGAFAATRRRAARPPLNPGRP